MDYKEFLEKKLQKNTYSGFEPIFMPDYLFDFQKYLIEWSLKKGKSALFADCGLGKTPMQLVWAENIIRKTNKNVLILTPLAVSQQTIKEGEKFGIEVKRSKDGRSKGKITITNYESLHLFDTKDYIGLVCDESSVLKNFNGKRKSEITQFMRKLDYRLLCTATAAPNDFTELGTSSEALGYMGYIDMLTKFYKNNQNTIADRNFHGKATTWRFKGHAEIPFWQCVSSWATAIRKPSDMGFDDSDFKLLPLKVNNNLITNIKPREDCLFNLPAIGLQEQRDERKRTIKERCEKVAELVEGNKNSIVWCNLNDEGDLLEKIIPDSKQVSGKQSDEQKENSLIGFQNNEFKTLIIKPKIGAFGLNYQNCSHITYFPTHSYEQYYQAVRRCYRFGQKETVKVDFVSTPCDEYIFKNLLRKEKLADKMFDNLIENMNYSQSINNLKSFNNKEDLPAWLTIKS
jgi:hypothetical protein